MLNFILICIVFNNITIDPDLATDWGYSAWLETGNETILFDTGSDGYLLLSNMQKMDKDPGDIDIIFISHNHADHTGGLEKLLTRTKADVRIYVPEDLETRFKHKYPDHDIIGIKKTRKIAKGIYSTGQLKSREGIAEQAMVIDTYKGLIVITGCSHPRIDRFVSIANGIEKKRPVYLVTGGFHMEGFSEIEFDNTVNELRRQVVINIGPTHCTGEKRMADLKEIWGENYMDMHLGSEFRIQK